MLIYALALVPMVLACGPAAGPTTDRPTLKFNYSSPLGWTYNDDKTKPAVGGQSLTKESAQNRINADIELAVIKAVESYGYSTTGVTVANAITVDTPTKIDTTNLCPATAPTEYSVQVDGVVAYECIQQTATAADLTDPTKAKPAIHYGTTITVTSPVALALSQWDNIATKVWASLTSNAGVKFYGLIEVSK